jgi:transposase
MRIVSYAKERGIRAAARTFKTTRATVRKWMRGFDGSLESLQGKSRRPHCSPNKIGPELEKEIIRGRRKLPGFSARRLKYLFDLPCSEKPINRVLKEKGLLGKYRKKKHKVKNNLRQVKRNWRLAQQIDADTKHLYDIPNYYPQMKAMNLPRIQYTAREVTTGALFIGYAGEVSSTYAELFARRISRHLQAWGVDLSQTTWQTDNGVEFIGSWQQKGEAAFTEAVEEVKGQKHSTIPAGEHTYQSDVETAHSLMELEFYDIESFSGRDNFMRKAATYQNFFNFARPNSYKEYKTPYELAMEKNPRFDGRALLLEPVYLENLLDQRLRIKLSSPLGHHVRYLP